MISWEGGHKGGLGGACMLKKALLRMYACVPIFLPCTEIFI